MAHPITTIWNVMHRLGEDMIHGLAAVAAAHTGVPVPLPENKPAQLAQTPYTPTEKPSL